MSNKNEFETVGRELADGLGGVVKGLASTKLGKGFIALWILGIVLTVAVVVGAIALVVSLI